MPIFEIYPPHLTNALARLKTGDHLCLIYETRKEQFAAAAPFMRIGLERGEQCIYIADENTARAVTNALRADGVNTKAALASGALTIVSKRETYLKDGYFDPDAMIRFLEESVNRAKAEGYSALRVTGEMTWALGGDLGAERLIEYEAKLNFFIPKHNALAICQYSRKRFNSAVILDVLRTHPLVIYGGAVCRNPHYIPPEELLGEKNETQEVERMLKNLRESEKAEKSLQTSEERYRALAESSTDMIFVIDSADRIQYANAAAARVMGCQPQELIGKPRADFFPPQTSERQKRTLQQAFETGLPVSTEEENIYPDGARWTSTQLVPLRNSQGEVTAVMGVSRDITERKLAEKSMEQARARAEHSERSLLALNQAAQSVQKALTPEEIYRAIGEEVVKLGHQASIYRLNDENNSLSFAHLTFAPDLLHRAEKLT
ncbi:MAG: MEDS domain-containing protein, partial [Anaerolineales bacterium]|nr:MEDS domain-containing protein [Anaerolineales bacterium]